MKKKKYTGLSLCKRCLLFERTWLVLFTSCVLRPLSLCHMCLPQADTSTLCPLSRILIYLKPPFHRTVSFLLRSKPSYNAHRPADYTKVLLACFTSCSCRSRIASLQPHSSTSTRKEVKVAVWVAFNRAPSIRHPVPYLPCLFLHRRSHGERLHAPA